MNKKLYCFIWTLRRMQACLYSGSPVSRAASRTLASRINRPPQSVDLKKCQLFASPSWQQSSHRYFSQDVQIVNAEHVSSNDEKNANDVLEEHGPMTVRQSQPPDSLASPWQGNSENEGIKKEYVPQQFFNELQLCNSPSDVLDLIPKHSLSQKYVSNCFSRMWVLIKRFSGAQRSYERSLMLEHPNFSRLCQILIQEAKFMWREDLVYSMLAVVKLGIPQDTLLVQTLLRVCQVSPRTL